MVEEMVAARAELANTMPSKALDASVVAARRFLEKIVFMIKILWAHSHDLDGTAETDVSVLLRHTFVL